jgi:hypothetical protein
VVRAAKLDVDGIVEWLQRAAVIAPDACSATQGSPVSPLLANQVTPIAGRNPEIIGEAIIGVIYLQE